MLMSILKTVLVAAFLTVPVSFSRADEGDGIVRIRSAVAMPEAIARIKKDIAAKGIKFFDEIDQAKLAADAGIKLRPSTLLVFGNPPLGTQVHHREPERWSRLAGAALADRGRPGAGLGCVYRLQLDRPSPRHHHA